MNFKKKDLFCVSYCFSDFGSHIKTFCINACVRKGSLKLTLESGTESHLQLIVQVSELH